MEKQIIEPFKFVKEDEVITPFKFVGEGEVEKIEARAVISPFRYVAKQAAASGKENGINVFDICHEVEAKYANMQIPTGEKPEEYFRRLEKRENERVKEQEREHNIAIPENVTEPVHYIKSKEKAATEAVQIVKASENLDEGGTVTNYTLRPLQLLRYINEDGTVDYEKESVEFEIQISQYHVSERGTVKVRDIERITSIIKRRFALAILGGEPNAAIIIEEKFRRDIAGVPVKFVLEQHGWQKVAGKWRYVFDDMQDIPDNYEVNTGYRLNSQMYISRFVLYDILKKAFNLTKNDLVAIPAVLFALSAPLYKLFEEANVPIRYLLFLNGKTGSMKSTIGKILFLPFTENGRREARRIDSDTITSIERRLVKGGRDTISFIDDYAPQGTRTRANEMKNQLEYLIRMVGDGATKSRSNANLDDKQGEGVKGIVAVAGEIRGEGLSSTLRCIYLYMQREEVNVANVMWFQKNSYAFPTVFGAFIQYIEKSKEHVETIIKTEYERYRETLSNKMKERRIIDAATSMCVVASILRDFLHNYCGMTDEELKAPFDRWILAIKRCAKINEENSSTEPPMVKFVKIVNMLRYNQKISIAKTKLSVESIPAYDGFEDDKYLYLLPDKVYVKTDAYSKQINQPSNLSLRDLQIALYEEGLLVCHSNGKNKKTYCARIDIAEGKKENFWQIKKEVWNDVLEASLEGNANVVYDENW